MATHVDLNADLGESYGQWTMGHDAELLDVVTSANVACGYHAGDPDTMMRTMSEAVRHGVGIGAHPGLPDLLGFGRWKMDIPAETLGNMIRYQIGAAQAMAAAAGGFLRHVKLHGALSHMAMADLKMARMCLSAALDVDPALTVLAVVGTPLQTAAEELGCAWVGEIYADRAYNDDATLVDRRQPGAVIHDPAEAAARVVEMVQADAIITTSGTRLPARVETICTHGDTPEAIEIARSVRSGLEAEGVTVRRFGS
jgi:UPF0271 protein